MLDAALIDTLSKGGSTAILVAITIYLIRVWIPEERARREQAQADFLAALERQSTIHAATISELSRSIVELNLTVSVLTETTRKCLGPGKES